MEYKQASPPIVPLAQKARAGTARTVVLVILATESVFFGTLLSAYLYLRAAPAAITFNQAGLSRITLPGINTIVLLLSAILAYQSVRAAQRDRQKTLKLFLSGALALGLAFVIGQVAEFYRLGWAPGGSIAGDAYFALVAFHAAHVVAGVIVMAFMVFKATLGDIHPRSTDSLQAAVLFWYYVFAVWMVLFSVLFLL